jgi:hypothetical protein
MALTDFSNSLAVVLQELKAEINDDMCRHPDNYYLTSPKCRGGTTSEVTSGRVQE